jgi:hypothetical protein
MRIIMLALILTCLLMAGPLPDTSGAGPVNDGLRLRLVITATQVGKHDVLVGIVNASGKEVTLISEQPVYREHCTYSGYLESEVSFEAYPKVGFPLAQTAVDTSCEPPKCVLQAGEQVVARWQSTDPWLKRDMMSRNNTSPCFPTDGVYGVRARFIAKKANGTKVLLTSAEQQVQIGAVANAPKHATGIVRDVDEKKNLVLLGIGGIHGVEKGDEYYIRIGYAAKWHLTVNRVFDKGSECRVETIVWNEKFNPTPPRFPVVGHEAKLVPVKDRCK